MQRGLSRDHAVLLPGVSQVIRPNRPRVMVTKMTSRGSYAQGWCDDADGGCKRSRSKLASGHLGAYGSPTCTGSATSQGQPAEVPGAALAVGPPSQRGRGPVSPSPGQLVHLSLECSALSPCGRQKLQTSTGALGCLGCQVLVQDSALSLAHVVHFSVMLVPSDWRRFNVSTANLQ